MVRSNDLRVLVSQPHRIYWAGLESTLPTMQQAGWEFAVHEDFASFRVFLVGRHRDMHTQLVTAPVDFHYAAMSMRDPMYGRFDREYAGDFDRRDILKFHVVRIAHRLQVETVGMSELPKFSTIDAQPQFVSRSFHSIDDLSIFAAPLVRTEELIVEPDQVSAILEKLRQAQVPEQTAIRARQRQRESREGLELGAEPQTCFHAQILSIAA